MNDGPDDPVLGLAQAAVQIHELFLSLVEGGFTEHQALVLIAFMFRPLPDDE